MSSLMLVNPRKRKKSTAKRKSISRRRSPLSARKTVHRKKYRRNPIGGSVGIMSQVKAAAVGAVGALAVDVALAKLPIPVTMKTGAIGSAVQGLVSIGIGLAVAKLGKNKSLGVQLATGGLTVAIHGTLKNALAGKIPGLAGISDLSGDLLGVDDGTLLGYEDPSSMGWFSTAPVSSGFSGFDDDDFNE